MGLRTLSILSADDGPAVEVINRHGAGGIVLVCEHASAFIPATLRDLGLRDSERQSHAVWDPGARDLSIALSEIFDAPLVAGRVSRLVYDCNRADDATDAMPSRTETIAIPGNLRLTAADRNVRKREIYDAFAAALRETLDRSSARALVTVHSFTPVWLGTPRVTQIGLLHDADDRLARAMLRHDNGNWMVTLNEPYSARDGVTHTLREYGVGRGIPNVMIEVRNDLLRDDEAVARMADAIGAMLTPALVEVAG